MIPYIYQSMLVAARRMSRMQCGLVGTSSLHDMQVEEGGKVSRIGGLVSGPSLQARRPSVRCGMLRCTGDQSWLEA